MKIAKVMFLWADKWMDGDLEQVDRFQSGYCICFGPERSSKVALNYVRQWYYEDNPGMVYTNKERS